MITFNQDVMAAAFNEWMRRYTEEPGRFEREWQTVGKYLAEKAGGEVPSYGAHSAAYLVRLVADMPNSPLQGIVAKPEPPPAPPNRSTREGTVPQP